MISEKEYKKAKKITDEYEEQERQKRKKRVEKIKDELTDYFSKNKVGGTTINDFDLLVSAWYVEIIINSPSFEDMYYPDELSSKKVEEIGNKYNETLKFPYYYYGK